MPILVVGAGTTGMTMAGELARHGARVRIVDRLAEVNPCARATGIHSRTLEVFQDLGVVDEVLALGLGMRTMNQYANGRRFAQISTEMAESPFPVDVMLEQYKTEEILERWLGRLGVTVERRTELVGLSAREDGVTATVRREDGREETVETPWLVGCDGAHSRVRELIGLPFPGEEDRHTYLIADVAFEWSLPHDEGQQFFSDRGNLFVFPLPDGRSLVNVDVPAGDAPSGEGTAGKAPMLEEVQALVDERCPVRARARDARWLNYFHIHYRLSPHYRQGRVFLAGDAVHIHSPFGGQGMNTGIQDAYNLAWKLALVVRGLAPASLLDSYEQERRAVAEDVIEMTRAITDRAEAFAGLPLDERERLFAQVVVPPAEQRRQAAHIEGLDLDYRDSSLCVDRSADDEGPHAGAQARTLRRSFSATAG